MQLKSKLQPDDIVVSYNTYYQDLPFYLNKNIIVANYRGELDYGLRRGADVNWVDEQAFGKIFNSTKKVYVVLEEQNFKKISKKPGNHLHLISKHLKTILASNQP